MIKRKIEIENIITNIQSNAELTQINTIPIVTLRKFIYSLFENGAIQIGKYRIVSWSNNDRHNKNKIWNDENKRQFESHGLLTKIKTENGDVFHEISNETGAQVWRIIAKEINSIDNKLAHKKEVKKANMILKYSHIHLSELIKKRDSLESERKQIMRNVSIAQINNRGHYTSVKVKEGYAERLISIIDNIDTEIEYRTAS